MIDLERPVAIATVPNDLEAERAISNKLHWEKPERYRWLAIPRSIDSLQKKTRNRLMWAYDIVPEYERVGVAEKIRLLAA